MPTPSNPAAPAGYRPMVQSEVTPEMTAWAVALLHDQLGFPMFSWQTRVFGDRTLLARVEWHPPDFQVSQPHRGVTLYEPIPGAADPSPPPSSPAPSSPPPTPPPAAKTLQGQLVEPVGGWTGARKLIAQDLAPPGAWLHSPEGAMVTSPRVKADPHNTVYRIYQRDVVVMEKWLPLGMLSVTGWTNITLFESSMAVGGKLIPRTSSDPDYRSLTVTVANSPVLVAGEVPLSCSILAAQVICDAWDCILPTFAIVDETWKAASQRLAPRPLVQTVADEAVMMSIAMWLQESDQIADELRAQGNQQSLTATWGKEYVMHPGLIVPWRDHRGVVQPENMNAATMYGWHLPTGVAIQSPEDGVSFAHQASYFDYSHRVRPVKRQCVLDGKPADLADVYRYDAGMVCHGRWVDPDPNPTGHGHQFLPCPPRHPMVVQ